MAARVPGQVQGAEAARPHFDALALSDRSLSRQLKSDWPRSIEELEESCPRGRQRRLRKALPDLVGYTALVATHEVLNQPPPLETNLFAADRALREAIEREGAGWATAQLLEL